MATGCKMYTNILTKMLTQAFKKTIFVRAHFIRFSQSVKVFNLSQHRFDDYCFTEHHFLILHFSRLQI